MKQADGTWRWMLSQKTFWMEAIASYPQRILGLVQNVRCDPTVMLGSRHAD
jgi:hypothetical protein